MIRNLLPICYGEKKPILITRILTEALDAHIQPEAIEQIVDRVAETFFLSLNTKTPQWIGEEEWRFGAVNMHSAGDAIPFNFAESIYLGENIETEWKNQLLKIAKNQSLIVYQRKLDVTKSKWIYEEILR